LKLESIVRVLHLRNTLKAVDQSK